jgi:hypothetical protein
LKISYCISPGNKLTYFGFTFDNKDLVLVFDDSECCKAGDNEKFLFIGKICSGDFVELFSKDGNSNCFLISVCFNNFYFSFYIKFCLDQMVLTFINLYKQK